MTLSRRNFIAGALGTVAVGAGGAIGLSLRSRGGEPIGASAIAAAEKARKSSGTIRNFTLKAQPLDVDLGGRTVRTWAYGDQLMGAPLRATAGDRVKVAFSNALPQPTSVHWHGLAIRNDMDGVPGVTTPEVGAGRDFAFDFIVPNAGTHWFHPHTGLQLDRGLYSPFIIDDPNEPSKYDAEWVVMLDDWTDGIDLSPDQHYAKLIADGKAAAKDNSGMGMGGMGMGGMNSMSMDGGDVAYSMYLINGRPTNDPAMFAAKPGQRIRLRLINASADTIYDVALANHTLTITHADGYPVRPLQTSNLRIGMGERYDITLSLADGVFPLVARPVGKSGLARALVRTASGSAPAAGFIPSELKGYATTIGQLRAGQGSGLKARTPDSTQDLILSGSMAPYVWMINDNTYENTVPLTIREGTLTRLRLRNMTMMPHPIHIHGHSFQLGAAGGAGPRKDTVLVAPMDGLDIDLLGDNPGKWMVHCHNAYHAEAGMMTRLDYLA